jgi:hypothetical protein
MLTHPYGRACLRIPIRNRLKGHLRAFYGYLTRPSYMPSRGQGCVFFDPSALFLARGTALLACREISFSTYLQMAGAHHPRDGVTHSFIWVRTGGARLAAIDLEAHPSYG